MKIIVTGANGMLGSDICPVLRKKRHVVFEADINIASNESRQLFLDISDFASVEKLINNIKPDKIIHLAAETDVDKCELNPEYTYRVNADSTENIAEICKRKAITLVYISTAVVFGGEKDSPYLETDEPRPQSVYGKSKLKGEEAVRALLKKYFILRAGWMIGGVEKDKKFVAKILRALESKDSLDVVNDRFGSPTFTKDFARCLADLISTTDYGLYHMVNEGGGCSRFELAKKIVSFLDHKGITVSPVNSNMFPLPAPRGYYEVLENQLLKELGMNTMRPWEESLKEYVLEWKRKRKI